MYLPKHLQYFPLLTSLDCDILKGISHAVPKQRSDPVNYVCSDKNVDYLGQSLSKGFIAMESMALRALLQAALGKGTEAELYTELREIGSKNRTPSVEPSLSH